MGSIAGRHWCFVEERRVWLAAAQTARGRWIIAHVVVKEEGRAGLINCVVSKGGNSAEGAGDVYWEI
jgi:hypothetical protein